MIKMVLIDKEKSIRLPPFYYEGRRKEFDQRAYSNWFNGLGYFGRGSIINSRANSIMKKHALNTINHLKKYLKERVYDLDPDLKIYLKK